MQSHAGLSFGFAPNATCTPPVREWATRSRACMDVPVSNASRISSDFHGKGGIMSGIHEKQYKIRSQRFCQQALNESTSGGSVNRKDDVSRGALIWRAIKLPIYSVALVPLTVGGAAAYLQTGVFSAKRYFTLLISSVLIITWLNLSNDVYDFDTGADKNKKESVVNLLGSRSGAFIAAYNCLIVGFVGVTWTSVSSGSIRANLLLTWAIICGNLYQCPPFRLSYQGLGEPLCFAAFGPFASTAFYLLLRMTSGPHYFQLTATVLSVSLLIGFTTTLILFCSHFHQVEEDKAVGKISPLVRLGTKRGAILVKVAVVTLYSLLVAFGISGALPLTCILLSALTLPMGIKVVRFVEENHNVRALNLLDKGRIFMAKYYCVRLHALLGAALTAGLVLARTVTTGYVPKPIFS
ncbi:unnamed protein product [Linum tenue]|uniref:Uncharacterized protein n=1 Tax=Linum tenue TaxID=586396 RepID=A0AAV0GVE7_9ROSI|nr:unnamed protein product [Linum tenue]